MSIEGVEITKTPYFNVKGKPEQLKMNEAWNAVVDANLSWQEQMRLGGRLALLQYNQQKQTSSPNASMLVIRNPEQPANNILRHAFRANLPPDFLPKLYDMLYNKNVNKENISDQAIRDYVEQNIPPEVYAALKDIYAAHVEYSLAYAKSDKARKAAEIEIDNRIKVGEIKPENRAQALEDHIKAKIDSAENTAKKEVFTVMIFQLVNSQYTLYVNERHNFKPGDSAEKARVPLLMTNMLANAIYDQGNNSNIYDEKGELTKVKPIPKGADSPMYSSFIKKINASKPNIPFESDNALVGKLKKADEAATQHIIAKPSITPPSSPPSKKLKTAVEKKPEQKNPKTKSSFSPLNIVRTLRSRKDEKPPPMPSKASKILGAQASVAPNQPPKATVRTVPQKGFIKAQVTAEMSKVASEQKDITIGKRSPETPKNENPPINVDLANVTWAPPVAPTALPASPPTVSIGRSRANNTTSNETKRPESPRAYNPLMIAHSKTDFGEKWLEHLKNMPADGLKNPDKVLIELAIGVLERRRKYPGTEDFAKQFKKELESTVAHFGQRAKKGKEIYDQILKGELPVQNASQKPSLDERKPRLT
ncbi:MAG: hypothetical protein HYX61_08745 [Gammaproteobacteria bacterium]|jgi:hypothetical protein|nr:hypothetical protein [Gammaproteobacteria bacterium]